MSTSDRKRRPARLGVEPLEWRLLPTAVPVLAVPDSTHGSGADPAALIGRAAGAPSLPEATTGSADEEPDGDEAVEYDLQHSRSQPAPLPFGALPGITDPGLLAQLRAMNLPDREQREREYERREELAATHLWGVALAPDARRGPAEYPEQHAHVTSALHEGTHNVPGSREAPQSALPEMPALAPVEPVWDSGDVVRDGAPGPVETVAPDSPTRSPAPIATPLGPVVESVEAAIDPPLLLGAPIAGFVPPNLVSLAADARDFLNHLADLGAEWCEESGPWEYLWLSAGVLLAAGLAHAAMVARSRERIRLTTVRPLEHAPGDDNGNQGGG